MENFDSILQIPIRSISDSVEIYSDELPEDVNDLLDVLKAEFAPLGIWRSAAVCILRVHGLNLTSCRWSISDMGQTQISLKF